jgi:hypothetical protein
MMTRRTLLVALIPLIAAPGCVIRDPSRRGRGHGKHRDDHDNDDHHDRDDHHHRDDDDARDRRRNRQYD